MMVDYRKKYTAKLKAEGRCVSCGKPMDRETGSLCIACKDVQNKATKMLRKDRAAKGICPRCGKNELWGDEKNCLECSANAYVKIMEKRSTEEGRLHYNQVHREWDKKDLIRCKEQGICTRCRKRKAQPGTYTCGICKAKSREAYHRRFPKVDREALNICCFCNEPRLEGMKVCEKHRQMNVEKAKKVDKKKHIWKKDNSIAFNKGVAL